MRDDSEQQTAWTQGPLQAFGEHKSEHGKFVYAVRETEPRGQIAGYPTRTGPSMMTDPSPPVDLVVTIRRFANGDVYKAVAKCSCGAWAHLAVGTTPHLSALEWLTEHVREQHPTNVPDSRPPYGTLDGGHDAPRSAGGLRCLTQRW